MATAAIATQAPVSKQQALVICRGGRRSERRIKIKNSSVKFRQNYGYFIRLS